MKKIFLVSFVLFAFIFGGFSQTVNEVKIGNVTNGTLIITNINYLNSYFDYKLNGSGYVSSPYNFQYSPDGKLIVLSGNISGNSLGISDMGISLLVYNNEAFFANSSGEVAMKTGIGGSAELTCTGNPCSSCYLEILSWIPFVPNCGCNDKKASGETKRCNMTFTYKIDGDVTIPVGKK